jgi:flagellar biosynthesis/type III secretory pathway chaperone
MNYAALGEVLRRQAAVMAQLQALLEEGRQALVANDPYRLQEVEREKSLVQQELQFLEEKRSGLCPAGKTLSALVESAPPEYKHQLAALLERSRRLAAELQEANALNRMLLEQSLAYVRVMQRTLVPKSDTFYSSGGIIKQGSLCWPPPSRVLDETA